MYVNHVYCQVSTILNCQLTYSSCQISDTILSPEVELRLLLDLKTPHLRWFVSKMKLWGKVYLKSMYLLLLFIDMVLSISIHIFNTCIIFFSSNLRLSDVNIKFDPKCNCLNFLIKQILNAPDSSLILYKSAAMFSPLMFLKGPRYDFRWKFHFWY